MISAAIRQMSFRLNFSYELGKNLIDMLNGLIYSYRIEQNL